MVCGKWPTFFFTVGTVSIGVVSAFAAGLHWLLWPLEGLMIMVTNDLTSHCKRKFCYDSIHFSTSFQSLLVLFLLPEKEPRPKDWKPKAHKPVEGLAIIYVLFHMWAPYIASFF